MENPVAKALNEPDTKPHVLALQEDVKKLDLPAAVTDLIKTSIPEDRHLIHYAAESIESVPANLTAAVSKVTQRGGR